MCRELIANLLQHRFLVGFVPVPGGHSVQRDQMLERVGGLLRQLPHDLLNISMDVDVGCPRRPLLYRIRLLVFDFEKFACSLESKSLDRKPNLLSTKTLPDYTRIMLGSTTGRDWV